MPHAPEIAVVLSTFERPRHLRRSLLSLAMQRGVERRFEAVVVDDGSTDETADVVARFQQTVDFPVKFVTHAHDGFQLARCRNAGIRASSAPYMLFTDGDCLFPPDHLARHLAARRPGVIRAGECYRLDQAASELVDGRAIRSGRFVEQFAGKARQSLRRVHFKSLFYQLTRSSRRPKLTGWNIAAWRRDLERVNGFDERFRGWGCEDDDLAARLRAVGVRVRTALGYTHGYHLWHPPHDTTPSVWRAGVNVQYLNRPLRLARCLEGLKRRRFDELTVRPIAGNAYAPLARQVVSRFSSARGPLELELLFWPATACFSRLAEHRVLVALDSQSVPAALRREADAMIRLGDRPTAAAIVDDLKRLILAPAEEPIAAPGERAAA